MLSSKKIISLWDLRAPNRRTQIRYMSTSTKQKTKTDGALAITIIRIRVMKNNVFVNVTKKNGQTILKFSGGQIQNKFKKYQIKTILKWILEKISVFLKINLASQVKIFLNGHIGKGYSFLKVFKKKGIKILTYKNAVPIPHNGCRGPKARRI